MAWTEPQSDDWSNIRFVQPPPPQPVTLLQQLPPATALPVPSVRPGHIKEDLVELMMMQNAQMHQVIMNNMTMSALSRFGYTHTPEQSSPPVVAEDNPEVYHHYYPCAPSLPHPVWMPPLCEPQMPQLQTIPSFQHPPHPPHTVHTLHRDRRAVPPPPPPSAAGTVGADVPPAAEYYEAERRQHETEDAQIR